MYSGIFKELANINLNIEMMRQVKGDSRCLLILIGLEIERIESQLSLNSLASPLAIVFSVIV